MTAYPLTYTEHLDLMMHMHYTANIRVRDQIAYHLSKSLQKDFTYIIKHNGVAVAEISARYVLIKTMQQLGMIS